jgi:ribosomal protein S18 acetylase RimI-like enzyme
VIAEIDEAVVGVALFRLFTNEEHGDGFIDEDTPELAVAVATEHRGAGIGARLLSELAEAAREAGFERPSLSVDPENPAQELYRRLGHRELARDERGVLMALDL